MLSILQFRDTCQKVDSQALNENMVLAHYIEMLVKRNFAKFVGNRYTEIGIHEIKFK